MLLKRFLTRRLFDLQFADSYDNIPDVESIIFPINRISDGDCVLIQTCHGYGGRFQQVSECYPC
jgi:hypothetical protein